MRDKNSKDYATGEIKCDILTECICINGEKRRIPIAVWQKIHIIADYMPTKKRITSKDYEKEDTRQVKRDYKDVQHIE